MGSFSQNAWNQLKNKTTNDLIRALLKDGFKLVDKIRTERIYRHPDSRKVSIHYHKGGETYGAHLLKELLKDTRWSEGDMRRLKLIK
jgi:predicted RNA binding protein YcfA (HicA-like mRNA interferase family)